MSGDQVDLVSENHTDNPSRDHDEADCFGEASPLTLEEMVEPQMDSIWLTFRKEKVLMSFKKTAIIAELFEEIEATFNIPRENQKIIVPKQPLITHLQTDVLQRPMASLYGNTLMLMGSPASTKEAMQAMSNRAAERAASLAAQKAMLRKRKKNIASRQTPSTITTSTTQKYTFLQVRPLNGLPHPERSQTLLMRLKNDPGIVFVMKKYKFSVDLLTEMEPLANTQTSHEGTSRTLGLNRNKGEVIELRLRTDVHDGYRHYDTIRKTLCHELAHNVHSNHDSAFWTLCHQIEREVKAGDWKSGGQTIGESSRYTISGQDNQEEDDHEDEGGWTGGEFVLGGVRDTPAGLTRRQILANAALERQKKDTASEGKAENGWKPCQRPHKDGAQ